MYSTPHNASDIILNGKKVAKYHLDMLLAQINDLKERSILPTLCVILVGEDPASQIYTRNKAKKCKDLGMNSILKILPDSSKTQELCNLINTLNKDKNIHGILVQLPLPPHVNTKKVLDKISPEKDVDGLHTVNVGKLHKASDDALIPCTAKGIIEILKYYKIQTAGKHAVVIGRSELVGKPIAALLGAKSNAKNICGNATVTVCHSASKNIDFFTQHADIIVCAIGKAHFLKPQMIKKGVVIIDVGINKVDTAIKSEKKYSFIGDVEFDLVQKKVSAISPVPGGVGPMTIAMLMSNTVQAAKNQNM